MTLNIILASLLIVVSYALFRSFQKREGTRRYHDEYCEQLSEELQHYKNYSRAIQSVLESKTGGVVKRIAECREIAEAVQKHAPDAFKKEPGLIYWIEATDQFLVELHTTAGLVTQQERFARLDSGAIYHQIHEATGLRLPSGELAHLST